MKLTKDYHVHSVFSKNNHGKSTIREIVERAVELKLEEIAITDHGPKHLLYGISENNIKLAKEEVIKLRAEFPNIKILLGVEANILDYSGTTDINDTVLKNCDIILCGFHLGARFSTFIDFWKFIVLNYFGKHNKKIYEKMKIENTKAYLKAMDKYKINILTHPGDKIPVDIDLISKKAEQKNIILEINNHHAHLSKDEIEVAQKYNVKFVIDSDAHYKDNIATFENALERAKEARLDLKRIVNLS